MLHQFFKTFACIAALTLSCVCLEAQTSGGAYTLKGVVSDEGGEPVIGAVVQVVGEKNGATITGVDGSYTISVPSSTAQVSFTCLGFKEQIQTPGGKSVLDVKLVTDAEMLEETVVIGYGVQKKVNLTGSVSSINFGKESENRAIVSTSASLAGLAAGLSVTQSSGQPGSDGATIRLRGLGSFTSGSCSPLVLVDGIEWSMDNVNPNDIENISVLKDAASTAIYGTRAANGVILITTKKGKESKPQISYSFKGIFQNPYNELHFVSDYATHMELINESCENVGTTKQFSQSNIDKWKAAAQNPNALAENGLPNYVVYPNTDWFSEIFQTGFSQEHNVSISGASKKINYLVSLGYLDNEGVMGRFGIDSSTKVFNFRTNLQADVTDWFTVGTKVFGQRQTYGLAGVSSAFAALYQTTPGVYPGSPNKWGIPALNDEESTNANNILRNLYGSGGYNAVTRLNASLFAQVRFLKKFSFEATGNYSPMFGDKHTYSRENGQWNYTTNERYSSSSLDNATGNNTSSNNYRLSLEALFRYNDHIGDHSWGALLGYSNQKYESWGFGLTMKGATDWSLNDLDTYSEYYNYSNTARSGWALQSFFGRFNYSYKDRYLVEANFRVDGSSRFGSNNRYGFFPSVSAGWKIHEERWMQDTKRWLSNLKLRASYGQTGNNNGIGNYSWQATYATENVVLDGVPTTGLYKSSLSNADLKWETTATTDIGLDLGFFGNKLTAEIDYYYKNTYDILYVPPVYMTMGSVSGASANLGSLTNQGVEISLNWKHGVGNDFSYYAGVNFSYNKNLVTCFKGPLEKGWVDGKYVNNLANVSTGSGSGKLCEGHAITEHYLLSVYSGSGKGYTGGAVDPTAGPVDGMIRTQADFDWVQAMMESGYSFNGKTQLSKDQLWYGDLIYEDRDGDKNYGDSDDMDFNGHTDIPSYNLGINLGCSWKGIDFSMVWSGAFDYYIIYNALYYNCTQTTNGHGISSRVAGDHYFYDVENPSDSRTNITATYPRLTINTPLDNRASSNFYEYKGDYLKLKNVQLGYTLPQKLTRKIYVQQLRFFCSGENLLTITSYPGLDPEKGATIGYPLMRSVTLGAQITF